MPLLTENGFGASGHQRPDFDGFIYIHYAALPYSAHISTICLLPFGKVWLRSICRVHSVTTKKNGEFTLG